MTELWRSGPVGTTGLIEAVEAVAGELGGDPVGFVSTPTEHRLVRFDGGLLHAPAGVPEAAGVFEARLFGPDAELRWVRTGPAGGVAVLIAERASGVPGWAGAGEPAQTIEGAYALWGRRFEAGPLDGWCRALEGRIGAVDVPFAGPPPAGGPGWPAGYLELCYREYIVADGYGNARIADERLIGIRAAAPTTTAR